MEDSRGNTILVRLYVFVTIPVYQAQNGFSIAIVYPNFQHKNNISLYLIAIQIV